MYYDRTLEALHPLIEKGGKYRWLFDYVRDREDLDFLVGKNNNKEWISIYRGLSRIISLTTSGNQHNVIIDAADRYKSIARNNGLRIYGKIDEVKLLSKDLDKLIKIVDSDIAFDRYYKNNKEGYYQNHLSRKYGLKGKSSDDFIIVDKEAVIGYDDEMQKKNKFATMREKYENVLNKISHKNPKRYGANLSKKAIGNEVDFVALDRSGNILLMELKHGTNTSGIYLSPIQLGLYYEIFSDHQIGKSLGEAIFSMVKQKQSIGLIASGWDMPEKIKSIKPCLVISGYNPKSSAMIKYYEVADILRENKKSFKFIDDIKVYTYSEDTGLISLDH
ncbi:MAG: hypothetical protein HQL29_00585 [Candidatus Omnitrophica bacterium]|nr:hypothetical protein [Candidatus Omnitrophota bacterium]